MLHLEQHLERAVSYAQLLQHDAPDAAHRLLAQRVEHHVRDALDLWRAETRHAAESLEARPQREGQVTNTPPDEQVVYTTR